MDLAPVQPRLSARQPIWLPGALLAVAHSILVGAAFVGGLNLARQPRNPVGWLVVGLALCFTLAEFCRQYALFGVLTQPGALPFARAPVRRLGGSRR